MVIILRVSVMVVDVSTRVQMGLFYAVVDAEGGSSLVMLSKSGCRARIFDKAPRSNKPGPVAERSAVRRMEE
jgi:hypothetical protein